MFERRIEPQLPAEFITIVKNVYYSLQKVVLTVTENKEAASWLPCYDLISWTLAVLLNATDMHFEHTQKHKLVITR